jgi:hypothetical protein
VEEFLTFYPICVTIKQSMFEPIPQDAWCIS